MLVDLSHRIDDLRDQVELVILGAQSSWSNYVKLIDDLNPNVAKFIGHFPHRETLDEMRKADFLLIPSHYEPGGIVVAEAMALGCGIVASDEVGSAENLPESACHRFPAGDMDRFEQVVREAISAKLNNSGNLNRSDLSTVAAEFFSAQATTADLLRVCMRAANRQPIGEI